MEDLDTTLFIRQAWKSANNTEMSREEQRSGAVRNKIITLTNLHFDLQPARSQESLVYQVWSIGHPCTRHTEEECSNHVVRRMPPSTSSNLTYNQDVIKLLHTIYLRQQLVDHSVMDAGAACHAASLLTYGIYFIKDDNVQPTVGTEL